MSAVSQMLKNPFVQKIIEAVKKMENRDDCSTHTALKKAIKQVEEEEKEEPAKAREKTKPGWFLEEMKFDFDNVHAVEKDENYFKLKAEMEAEAKLRGKKIEMMMGEGVVGMNLNEYKKILNDREMASTLMQKIKDQNNHLQKINVEALCKVIGNAEKDLFI